MPDVAPEQMMISMPDELDQAIPYDQVVSEGSHFNLGRLGRVAAVGLSTAAAFVGAEFTNLIDSSRVASALGAMSCNITSPNYNTVACGPHGPVAKHCLQAAMYPADGVSVQYSDKIARVSMKSQDMHGCNPAGIRELSVSEKLRKGPSGTFKKNGNTFNVKTDYSKAVNVALKAPYSCAVDGAGSAVEIQVRNSWQASGNYKVPGHPKLSKTRTYKVQTVC
jgi:hypothetical protein